MKIKCMYYDKHYTEKPNGYEIGIVQKSLKPTEIDIKDLAYGLSHGCTFKPALLTGTKSKDFVSQEVFALDFDDGIMIDEALKRCEKLNLIPAFGYTSFSHKPEHHKFRLVFRCNNVITDDTVRDKIQLSLMAAFPECDIRCKDISRLFFGGRQLLYENYDSVFDPDELIEKYFKEVPIAEAKSVSNSNGKQKKNIKLASVDSEHNEKIEAIKNLDVTAMRRLLGFNNPVPAKKNIDIKIGFEITSEDDKIIINDIMQQVKDKFGIGLNEPVCYKSFTKQNQDNFINAVYYIVSEANKRNPLIKVYFNAKESEDDHNLGKGGQKKRNTTPYSVHLFPENLENPIETTFVGSKKEIYDLIRQIDLFEFLGVSKGNFRCILPDHEDVHPSANVFISKYGSYLYKCWGCGCTRSITGIVEELSGCKRYEANNFIKAIYNIELKETDWTRKWKDILISAAQYLDTEEFQNEFPELNKRISRQKGHLKNILLHLEELVNDDLRTDDDTPLFFQSYRQLKNVCHVKSQEQIVRMITQFVALNFLNKPPVEEIPNEVLHKAKAIAAKNNQKKLTNFFSVSDYGVQSFKDSERLAKILTDNNVRVKSLSREFFMRTFDKNDENFSADKIYPQFTFENSQGTSEESDKFTLDISACMLKMINQKGYTTEREIINILTNYGYKAEAIDTQIKRSLQEILDTYDLKRIRANKAIKEKYNVTSSGFPFIIIKGED